MSSFKRLTLSVVAIGLLLRATAVLADLPAHSTVAVGGYDLVSYHNGKKPVRGNGNHVIRRDGATYLFANYLRRNEEWSKYVDGW